jgi:hypothetical protein
MLAIWFIQFSKNELAGLAATPVNPGGGQKFRTNWTFPEKNAQARFGGFLCTGVELAGRS